jgi:arabinogalactan endo-1,4-beta-galactosidase
MDANEERRALLVAGIALLGGAASASMVGCGGGGGGGGGSASPLDSTAPTLVSQSPAANALDVARSTAIELTFSEPVAATTNAVTVTGQKGVIEAVSSAVGAKVSLVPRRRLGFGERNTVAATSAVRDSAGNAYLGSVSSFTTIPRNTALALGGLVMDTYVRRRWTNPAANPWDALPDLVDNGFEWLRVAVTTKSHPELRATNEWHNIPFRPEFWSSLEVSGALLRAAADQGMRLQAMLFLSHTAADAGGGRQARPPEWAGLSETEVAVRVEQHAMTVATYYKSLGLAIEVFEIGNEIDFGVCGIRLGETVSVPAGIDPVNAPVWMRDNVWVLGAPLLKAAIRGAQAVYPAARILLHVAGFGYSRGNIAASGFFQSMLDLGVPFDIAGLSYPYQFGSPSVSQPYFTDADFQNTLARIAAFGKPLQIVEFNYPSDPTGATTTPASAYPFTPDGQAAFIRDFAASVRGKVQAIHYFYPDWYPGFDATHRELEAAGLFGAVGLPRPALEVFNAIAERRLLT